MKKKISALIVMGVISISALVSASACGGNKFSEISVSKNKLQTTFVKGQDIDWSDGVLQLKGEDYSDTVSLSDPEVQISGYDNQTVGAQTVTVTYRGVETTVDVNCVERLTPDSRVVTNYFVGDELSLLGNLYVYADDGTSKLVSLRSDAFTFEYDFSEEDLSSDVTVTYQADGVSYTCAYQVKVYDASDISLKSNPSKTGYKNYESLDLTGAKLELKNSEGNLSKTIAVTEDMLGEYDLTSVTEEEGTKVVAIPVSFGGVDLSFNVNVTYTPVLEIRQEYETLAAKDYNFEEDIADLTIEEEDGKAALSAIEKYIGMADADKAQIAEEEYLLIAKVAAVYGYGVWEAQALTYTDLYTVSEIGAVSLADKTYEATKAQYVTLTTSDEGKAFLALAEKLNAINELCGDSVLFTVITPATETEEESIDVYTFEDFLSVTQKVSDTIGKIGHAIELYELFDGQEVNEALIRQATDVIRATSYNNYADRDVYDLLTEWDEDYFDQIYSFYYGDGSKGSVNTTAINYLKDYYLPTAVEEPYRLIRNAIIQANYMNNGYRNDTSYFMLFYFRAQEKMAELTEAAEKENATLYEKMCGYCISDLKFSGIVTGKSYSMSMLVSLLTSYPQNTNYKIGGGYLYIMGYAFEQREVMAMWDSYLVALNKVLDGDESYLNDVPALLRQYAKLSPNMQKLFLDSLNAYYGKGVGFDVSWESGSNNLFSNIVYAYYLKQLNITDETSANYDEFVFIQDVLCLSELLAQGKAEEFVKNWNKYAVEKYATVDKSLIGAEILSIYNKLDATYNYIVEVKQEPVEGSEETETVYAVKDLSADPQLSAEMAKKFENLRTTAYNAYYNANMVYYYCANYGVDPSNFANILPQIYAAYFYAEQLSREIQSTATREELNAYYYNTYYGTKAVNAAISVDQLLLVARTYAVFLMNNMSSSDYPHWALVHSGELQDLLISYGKLIALNGYQAGSLSSLFFSDNSRAAEYTVADAVALMKKVDEMSFNSRLSMRLLDSGSSYFTALGAFFAANLDDATAIAASELLNSQYYGLFYEMNPDGKFSDGTTYKQAYFSTVYDLKCAYGRLTESQKTAFDQNFGEYYTSYVSQLPAISTAIEAILAQITVADGYLDDYLANPVAKQEGKTYGQLFNTAAQEVKTAYAALSEEDKKVFDSYFKLNYNLLIEAWTEYYGEDATVVAIKEMAVLVTYYEPIALSDPDGMYDETTSNWNMFKKVAEDLVAAYETLTVDQALDFDTYFLSVYSECSGFLKTFYGNSSDKVNEAVRLLYTLDVYEDEYEANPYGTSEINGTKTNQEVFLEKFAAKYTAFLTIYNSMTDAEKTEFGQISIVASSFEFYKNFMNDCFISDAEAASQVARDMDAAIIYLQMWYNNRVAMVEIGGETKLAGEVFLQLAGKVLLGYQSLDATQMAAFNARTDGNNRVTDLVFISYYFVAITAEAEEIETDSAVGGVFKDILTALQTYYKWLDGDETVTIGDTSVASSNEFMAAGAALVADYTALSDDEKETVNTAIGGIYQFVVSLYQAALNASEAV